MGETLSTNKTKSELLNTNDYLISSKTCNDFFSNNTENFSFGVFAIIEMTTRGQSDNLLWFLFRKGIITASKSHEVMTKMKKIVSGERGVINLWSSFQKASGITYKNPKIPALKYKQEMKGHAAEKFKYVLSGKERKNLSVKRCGLFFDKIYPFIGASPDCIVKCDCHKN